MSRQPSFVALHLFCWSICRWSEKLWLFFQKVWILNAKVRKNPVSCSLLTGFYEIFTEKTSLRHHFLGGGGGGVVTLEGLCCCGLGSLFGIIYLFGFGGGGVGTLVGDSRCWVLLFGISLRGFRWWRGIYCWRHWALNLLHIVARTDIRMLWRITSIVAAHL